MNDNDCGVRQLLIVSFLNVDESFNPCHTRARLVTLYAPKPTLPKPVCLSLSILRQYELVLCAALFSSCQFTLIRADSLSYTYGVFLGLVFCNHSLANLELSWTVSSTESVRLQPQIFASAMCS